MRKDFFGLEILIFAVLIFSFFPRLTEADPVIYDAAARRDPFVPLIGPGGSRSQRNKGDIQIEGIIFDPQSGSLALINGEFYKPGQRVGEATVISILKDRVLLSQDDEEKTFWMREEILPKGDKKHASNASKLVKPH